MSSSYFISRQNPRMWFVIWRALVAVLAGVSVQAVTLRQLRGMVCGWSYEGSLENRHYFKSRRGRSVVVSSVAV